MLCGSSKRRQQVSVNLSYTKVQSIELKASKPWEKKRFCIDIMHKLVNLIQSRKSSKRYVSL